MNGRKAKKLRKSIEGYKELEKRAQYKHRITGQIQTDKVRREYQHAKKSNI